MQEFSYWTVAGLNPWLTELNVKVSVSKIQNPKLLLTSSWYLEWHMTRVVDMHLMDILCKAERDVNTTIILIYNSVSRFQSQSEDLI